ncbi:MAG: tetratricopeptide repeat protein, partial [Planctomycetota bacterium]
MYALGVILYEMLAGRLPYDLRDHSIAEAGSVIREQEPSRLSSLDSALRGDIETIVAKALAKEKDRRYQSAIELGDDIRRFLQDEPIVARPASRAYQIRKFAKRNKAIVGGVTAVFLTLVLGIVGISMALIRATKAERVALQRSDDSRRSAAKATAVSSFLQEMLSSVDPAKALGREVTIRQALDEAAAKIESGSLKDQPDIEADLRTSIGTTYLALGHYPDAEPHLRTTLEIRRRLHGDGHPDVAVSLNDLASLRNAQGRHAEGESLLREALMIQRRLHGDKHVDVASTMQSLGAALRTQHKYEEAEPFYRSALAMRRELLGAEHIDVAQTVNSLALLLQNKADYAAAEPLFREALSMRRKLLGDPHPIVAGALNNLAMLLKERGDSSEAESLLREALDMRRKLLDPEHPDVAQSMNNLAILLYEKGDYSKAEALYREALGIWRKTLPEGHVDIGNG